MNCPASVALVYTLIDVQSFIQEIVFVYTVLIVVVLLWYVIQLWIW